MSDFKEHYDNKKEVYGISKTRKKKIFQLLGDVKYKKILDFGCGGGHLGKVFMGDGNYVCGVDISRKSVDVAKKVINEAVCIDAQQEKLPYKDEFFDIIIMGEIIEHLLEPERVMLEIKRVLNKDGFVIITTPNFLVFSNRIKMLLGKFEYTETGFLDRGHVHFFQFDSFRKMIDGSGLKVDMYNNVYHGKIPEFMGRLWPNLFAFQIVAKVSKKK
ncbi:MAG: class I SAM-dependent methyltransferase [bacterium]